MSDATVAGEADGTGWFSRRRWGRGDLVALAIWTAAVVWIFRDAVTLRGRSSTSTSPRSITRTASSSPRSCGPAGSRGGAPGSIAGCRFTARARRDICTRSSTCFYPWMETWKAFNFDTVFSVWLAGAGTYGWLRRHVGPAGALTGAALFGMGGFTWAHIVHTSMINALASVPFVIWGLEWSWEPGGGGASSWGPSRWPARSSPGTCRTCS